MTNNKLIDKTLHLLKNEPYKWDLNEYRSHYKTPTYFISIWHGTGISGLEITLSAYDPNYPGVIVLGKEIYKVGGLSFLALFFGQFTWRGKIFKAYKNVKKVQVTKTLEDIKF